MRHKLFHAAQNMFKNASKRPALDQIILPPDAFKVSPASNALAVGMSLVIGGTTAGLWMHERRSKSVADNKSVDATSARKLGR